MKTSSDRILTTHAGSLPRPHELAIMLHDVVEGRPVDGDALQKRVAEAVVDVVARQCALGVDVVSDGEMGKSGFSSYVLQRFSGFGGDGAKFVATDLADYPQIADEVFGDAGSGLMRLPVLEGPIERRGSDAVGCELATFRSALGEMGPDSGFVPAVTPGQVAFNFPNRYYSSHRDYIEAAGAALAPEYQAIVQSGFNLQLDSPDSAMAFHSLVEGSDLGDPREHLAAAVEVLDDALAGLPADKLRYHVCWGNYRGPHHKDIELTQIIDVVLRTRAKYVYIEAANPRHEHEWEVWQDISLPEDKALIVGVIDTKSNHVEHPQLVAQRIERFTNLVGRERVVAGTDCGFATSVGVHVCPPALVWAKLEALVRGADLASRRRFRRHRERREGST
jgi:5-methyltetrahydropteroyltriglutamate--homocysteine methyltransferase